MKSKLFASLTLCLAIVGLSAFSAKTKTEMTFTKHIAPIFFKSCAECHRPGEAAPFSVLSYKDVRPWAKSIKEKVLSREMPPWHADPHVGQWANDSRLTQAEIDTITAWVDSGAPEGATKDLPPVPTFTQGWRIGHPDVVVTMPEPFKVEASGPDEYQYFEVDPGFTRDTYVQQAEARPGNRRIVHHIIVFIKPPTNGPAKPKPTKAEQEAREREMMYYREGFLKRTKTDAPVHDNSCQLPNGGAGERIDAKDDGGNIVWLAAYAPGTSPYRLPANTAIKVPAGSKLLFQMHYSKVAGSEQMDRSSIGLVLAKQPPAKELLVRAVANEYFRIPAGATDHQATACWTVPEDINVYALTPHMHVRGKSQLVEAIFPDGRRTTLLNVPRWDFAWQTNYETKQALILPKGTRVIVTSTFDNSARNKFNPDPSKPVRWGEPTYDEMLINFISYTTVHQSASSAVSVQQGSR